MTNTHFAVIPSSVHSNSISSGSLLVNLVHSVQANHGGILSPVHPIDVDIVDPCDEPSPSLTCLLLLMSNPIQLTPVIFLLIQLRFQLLLIKSLMIRMIFFVQFTP